MHWRWEKLGCWWPLQMPWACSCTPERSQVHSLKKNLLCYFLKSSSELERWLSGWGLLVLFPRLFPSAWVRCLTIACNSTPGNMMPSLGLPAIHRHIADTHKHKNIDINRNKSFKNWIVQEQLVIIIIIYHQPEKPKWLAWVIDKLWVIENLE